MSLANNILCFPSLARNRLGITNCTITFDTTHGPVGTFTVFTITGRVAIRHIFGFCTVDLVSAGGGSLALTVPAVPATAAFMAPTTATTIDALQWWISNGTPIAGHSTLPYNASGGATVSVQNKLLNTNVTASVTVGDITAGALVVTAIYTPLSDGARLN